MSGVYREKYATLPDLNIATMLATLKMFGVDDKDMLLQSRLGIDSKKDKLIMDICKSVDADIYYSGTGARDYQNEDDFEKIGVKLIYQDFKHPVYKQINSDFVEGCAGFDMAVNDAGAARIFAEAALKKKEALKKEAAL